MNQRRLASLVAIVLLAAACGGTPSPTEVGGESPTSTVTAPNTTTPPTTTTVDPSNPTARLAAARALWAETDLSSYVIETQQSCFCPQASWIDTVVNGEVKTHRPATPDAFYDPGARTMEDLFDEVSSAITDGYAKLDLKFDTTSGALVSWWVDVDERMADEEHGVTVLSLTSLPGAIDASALADDYGCGFGFAKGSSDQGIAIVIRSTEFGPGDGPDVSTPITFPAAGWSAEVEIGADLFSNWCNDVIQTSDPVPTVAQSWPLVEGTLTFAESGPAGTMAATLVGAAIGPPDGDVVQLDDIALTNDCWGCFPG